MFSKIAYDAHTHALGEPETTDIRTFMENASGLTFLHGLYTQDADPVVIRKLLFELLDAMITKRKSDPSCSLTVCTTSDKKLKNPLTDEIVNKSMLTFPKGYYPATNQKRPEGTFTYGDDETIVWQSMVFPFSNFGHTPINKKLKDIVSLDTILGRIGSKPHNLDAISLVMDITIKTVETLIQAILKILAAALMPAKLTSDDSIKFFKTNVEKLDRIEVGGQKVGKPLKIMTSEELTAGMKHSFGTDETDDLDVLVGIVNKHIFETIKHVTDDKTVKALGNALNIDPKFFMDVGNGTPYPLGKPGPNVGANTYIQAAGILLRYTTDEDFKALMDELRLRKIQIGESAGHWRGSFYYIDNTFGGGFGVQLAPPQDGILFKGKEHVFYNAMGHGYTLAQAFLSEVRDTTDYGEIMNQAGLFILQAVQRIVDAC